MRSIFQSVTWGGSLILLLVFAAVGPAVAQTCVPPPGGLIGWWPGDGNAEDIIGDNNGNLHGSTGFTSGLVGQAFEFHGTTGEYVEVPDSQSLDIQNAITIESLVYIYAFPTNNPWWNMQVLQKDGLVFEHAYALPILGNRGLYHGTPPGPSRPREFGLEMTLDRTGFPEWSGEILESGGIWSNVQLSENTWHHLAATYDGGQANVYLDGALIASYFITGTIETNDNPVHIGNYRGQNTDFFNGLIDELRIYNRALTADEIAVIYNAGSAGVCKSVDLLVCEGFDSPFDVPLLLKKNVKRTIPVKIKLADGHGAYVTDQDLAVPPVINVLFTPADDSTPVDLSDQLLPQGAANEDNIFRFDPDTSTWVYNLGTKQFLAAGTYTVTVAPGDVSYEHRHLHADVHAGGLGR